MGSLKEVTLPEGLESSEKVIWGNIHQIYDWHKETFSVELAKCLERPELLGGIFVRYVKSRVGFFFLSSVHRNDDFICTSSIAKTSLNPSL